MKIRWFAGSWVAVAGMVAVAVLLTLDRGGTAGAATENFGPPLADVTIEDGDWKVVHLTSSKFMWQFRDDQEPVEVWGYNEQIPGPTLRFREGDKLRVYYRNDLDEASTIHWHGLIVPNSMDGVGLLTGPAVMPGETFVYEFQIPNTPGTFMYHAHMNDMEQVSMGMSGGFIIDPRDGGNGKYDQDRLVVLNNIKGHYLINGKEFPNVDPWIVKTGDLVRVRMINISPVEIHPMHFHGHFSQEVAKDGTDIRFGNGSSAKVENTVFIAPGQTVDVSVEMEAPGKGAWIFHCHVLSHVMGPDGKSLLLEEANGGMVIPVAYSDSENFDDIAGLLAGMLERLKAKGASGVSSGVAEADPLGEAVHDAMGALHATPTP